MTAERLTPLIERLPRVRGSLEADAPLARFTWFKVGGPAEVLFEPADGDDLAGLLAAKPAEVPVTVIGVGSNIIVRDGGIEGIVVRLGRGFAAIDVSGDEITAGAGAHDMNVARSARDAGLSGLEFLAGIPGTIGGTLSMNGGAFGHEVKDVIVDAEVLDPTGRRKRLALSELAFGYRKCGLPEDWTFIAARLRGAPGDKDEITRRMEDIQAERETSQPLRTPTGGSTFKNPEDAPEGKKAWELIEKAGCRGLRRGGAEVSEKHCNFLINTSTATAADLEGLGEEVRRRVFETTGVKLEWEIRRLGVAGRPAAREVTGEGDAS
ncbi:MAG: UDP-N-acetylmuramate dehydrogenase [Proteobacteria bacterium]|nr:UDP-N-acetylmuramate dehydrogenase [Pseudomonadota bacterium]